MSASARTKRSLYMEWAKTRSHAKYNLATSGLIGVPRDEFPLNLNDLEITAPGGYGYAPLQQRLARQGAAPFQADAHRAVIVRRTQAVDAGNGSDDDHVLALQ